MEKWLCWATMGISGLMFVVFLMDLVIGVPFGGRRGMAMMTIVDLLGLISSGLIFYLGWDSLKDTR